MNGVETGAATEVEHSLTGLDFAALVWIANAGKRCHRTFRRFVEPLGVVTELLRGLAAMEKVEFTVGMVGDFLVHAQDLAFEDAL